MAASWQGRKHCSRGTFIAWSHYSAITSEVIEDFMCAVATIFSMYILVGLLQLLLVMS
jgi:hypothetical protein